MPDRRYVQSSSFTMALFFTVLLSSAAGLLGYQIYDFGRQGFIRETEAAIEAQISGVLLAQQLSDDLKLTDILETYFAPGPGNYYRYATVDGTYLLGDLKAAPSRVSAITEGLIRFKLTPDILVDRNHPDAGNRVAAKIHTFSDGRQLMVLRDIEDNIQRLERIQFLTLVSIVFMLMVISVSFFISSFVVSRINRIAMTAEGVIQTGDLSQRINIQTRWDDLSYLAHVLNSLLSRIEQLVQGVKSVSDNIAHDLRTPLTRLRNQLEQLRESGKTDPELVELLIDEADHLLETFAALLRIARIDGSKITKQFTSVPLHTLLEDAYELYAPLAEDQGQTIVIESEPITLQGDRDLLFQVVANLLDNALKFTPTGGSVTLSCQKTSTEVELTVIDSGPGIPEADRERVFERFYRGETSRSTRGNGLGLSLVKVVMELHQGRVELKDAHPGLEVRLHFPCTP
jgi:signal transduction histidine kinase